ncbi:MAG: tRNA glutamyl-Q(34) synthetase GluQRS [Ghiorsea sp.]
MRTRFAPSPTGQLHTGNAYSALQCEQWAKENDAELLLRIEDIDFTRCRENLIQQILEDLAWLDIYFDGEVTYQSQRTTLYQQALEQLIAMKVLYPCFCTRKEVLLALEKQPSKQEQLDDYPGTCRLLTPQQRETKMNLKNFCWRLDVRVVSKLMGQFSFWTDTSGKQHPFSMESIGDVIIGRKDIQYSYHLAVVVDDAAQDISHVIRGEDLRSSTPVHRVLQDLLGYDAPLYFHHDLIKDEEGERLAKTKNSITLKSLRDSGISEQELRKRL